MTERDERIGDDELRGVSVDGRRRGMSVEITQYQIFKFYLSSLPLSWTKLTSKYVHFEYNFS